MVIIVFCLSVVIPCILSNSDFLCLALNKPVWYCKVGQKYLILLGKNKCHANLAYYLDQWSTYEHTCILSLIGTNLDISFVLSVVISFSFHAKNVFAVSLFAQLRFTPLCQQLKKNFSAPNPRCCSSQLQLSSLTGHSSQHSLFICVLLKKLINNAFVTFCHLLGGWGCVLLYPIEASARYRNWFQNLIDWICIIKETSNLENLV